MPPPPSKRKRSPWLVGGISAAVLLVAAGVAVGVVLGTRAGRTGSAIADLPEDPAAVETCEDVAEAAAQFLQVYLREMEQYSLEEIAAGAYPASLSGFAERGQAFAERFDALGCTQEEMAEFVSMVDNIVVTNTDTGRMLKATLLPPPPTETDGQQMEVGG